MFVRAVDQMRGTNREGKWQDGDLWLSAVRLVTKSDLVGFSLADVRASAGWEIDTHYKNHVEANYVIEGEGTAEDLTTGEKWNLYPGSMYFVGPKDRHQVNTHTGFYLLSVFNPPLVGDETHDSEGGYPYTGPLPEAWRP